MDKLNAKQWSNYWEKGTVTTFHKKFENNYDGEIKAHWNKQFVDLESQSTVIDLATGNGALLVLLDDYLNENKNKNFKAYGVDFAELNTEFVDKIKSLTVVLKDKTLIEDTGIEDSSIDLAMSQYGIEYSDLDKTVCELDRIMKPKSKLNFIMHHSDSQIIKEGFQSLSQIELVNNKLKLNNTIKELLPAIDKLKETGKTKYKTKADRLRNKLNKGIQEMMNFSQTVQDPGYIQYYYENALMVFKGSVAQQYSLIQKLKLIKLVENETKNLKLRMKDLTSVAMTEDKNEKFINLLKNIGFVNINIVPIEYNAIHIGQNIQAQRNL